MPERPLDTLRLAHRTALGQLDLLEKSIGLVQQNSSAAWEPLDKVFGFFDGELKVHFRHEEEILFPYLAQVIGREGPIAAMLDEHQTLWRAWDAFQEQIAQLKASPPDTSGKVTQTAQQIANHIVGFLRSHIQKEDGVLFPLAEESLAPKTLREVVANLQAVETPA